jgi:hypothetical protein
MPMYIAISVHRRKYHVHNRSILCVFARIRLRQKYVGTNTITGESIFYRLCMFSLNSYVSYSMVRQVEYVDVRTYMLLTYHMNGTLSLLRVLYCREEQWDLLQNSL